MTTDLGTTTQRLTKHEARRRLEHERNSRLAQLRAIEESAPLADEDLQAAQTAAIRRVLDEIDAAGRRLADGSYGTCDNCQTAIPVERLEILPYVRFCVGCQQRAS
ncbi:TraR/DksA C4-type zinc finger protein [Kribbella sp. NBC_00482]|uniref:TraR/DksA family transcriptional regulator n=1 Tax=Kribbella sp. NBC_00482 TaxID=2975968 RepID=UPI002E16F7BD